MLLNLLETLKLVSALEQFELLTYPNPCSPTIFGIRIYFPREFLNNLSQSLTIIMFYLWAMFDLKEINIEYVAYKMTKDNKKRYITARGSKLKIAILSAIIPSIGRDKKAIIATYNNDLMILKIGSLFIIYKIMYFIQKQIIENLTEFKPIYFNYIFCLFIFLFSTNYFAMIPFSLTATSYLVLTLNLSGMSFFGNLFIAIKSHKLLFFKFFIPQGVSGLLLILMVVIELISYAARLFSMAIRLFANMLSGHALVKILSGLIFLTLEGTLITTSLALFFNMVILGVIALEFVVAILQAYVFVVLSIIYTNEAIVLH